MTYYVDLLHMLFPYPYVFGEVSVKIFGSLF